MMSYTGKVMPAESRIVPSVKGDLNVAYDATFESAQVARQLKSLVVLGSVTNQSLMSPSLAEGRCKTPPAK